MEDKYVFTDMFVDSGIFDDVEKNIYDYVFDSFYDSSKGANNYNIFLEVSIPTLMKRIKKRGRKEEATIDTNYLETIDKKYSNLRNILGSSIITLNVENDFEFDTTEKSRIIKFFKDIID